MRARVLVVGAGGLGGVIAARLRRVGWDVPTLVRSEASARALAATGFRVDDLGERLTVPARPLASLEGEAPFDLILLATQPPDVEEAARGALPWLAPDGAFVVLQNGLCEPRVAAVAGPERVVGAVVAWGAEADGPGQARRTSRGGFTVGRWDGAADGRVARAVEALTPVAPCRVTDNLPGARWSKLALNCAISTLGTLGGDRVGPLIAHAFVRRLALEIMSEAVAVARAEGVRLERLAGAVDLEALALTPAQRVARVSPGRALKSGVILLVGARIRNLRSSMLRALEQGRAPAVDFLNGEVVAAGRRHHLPTPVNAAAVDAVHRVARGDRRSSLATLRELHALTRPPKGAHR